MKEIAASIVVFSGALICAAGILVVGKDAGTIGFFSGGAIVLLGILIMLITLLRK